jgi:protease-4
MAFFDYIKNIFMLLIFLLFAPGIFEGIRTQYGIFVSPKTHVGVIKIQGDLCHSAWLTKQLHAFFSNNDIKAVLLTIESCGGAAGTGQAVAREILTLKKKYPKPVIALTENMCASGAYYIASATDYIISSGQALIGSIGSCIPHLFQLNDFLQKHAIGYTLIKSGTYKASTDPFVTLNDESKAHLQSVVDNSYEQFIEDIAHNRKLALQNASLWADGKIFTGKQAKELNLVDELGSASQAIAYIKDKQLIDGDIEWIQAEPEGSFLQRLFNGSAAGDSCGLFGYAGCDITGIIKKICFNQSGNGLH